MEFELEKIIRIWIAEDEEELLELLTRALTRKDRTIKPFKDGENVLEELKKSSFDILLTDLMMPEVDGIQLLNEAKKRYPDGVVIIMTGYASLDSAIQAIRGGAYDYIRKPFKIEELEIVIQKASERIFLQRENRHLIKKLEEMIEDTKRLKQIWEDHWMRMIEICRTISYNKTIEDMELILKQIYPIPPDHDLKISQKREKSFKIFEVLIQMKSEGLLSDEQFNSFLKIFLGKLLESS